jgi:OFA family oxalate/formate antiporter-like MFS transporter
MDAPIVPGLLSRRVPVFYGWIVLACLCCAGFARQGPAVATLSIFIEPLTREFGWSRTALSGAASLGGLLAAVAAPLIGPVLDRRGSRLVLCAAVLVNGALLMLLSLTPSLLVFYLLFCVARMNWAAPFELGLYGALNNWFVRRRTLASATLNLALAAGLIVMPLVAQAAIMAQGWRAGWLAIGAMTLLVGFVPIWLLLVRRPEDLGLSPDGAPAPAGGIARAASHGSTVPEPAYSRRQALGTGAFWFLLLYTVLVFPVQAGVSLHQAPFLIERGIDPTVAATIVSTFSLTSALATLVCGALPRGVPIRYPLALTGTILTLGVVLMLGVETAPEGNIAQGYVAAGVFGFGIGAILTLLPIAWADYFGRAHFGAIRGIALPAQVLAQAVGPVLSGALHDLTGSYVVSLQCFAVLAGLSIAAAMLARQPHGPAPIKA